MIGLGPDSETWLQLPKLLFRTSLRFGLTSYTRGSRGAKTVGNALILVSMVPLVPVTPNAEMMLGRAMAATCLVTVTPILILEKAPIMWVRAALGSCLLLMMVVCAAWGGGGVTGVEKLRGEELLQSSGAPSWSNFAWRRASPGTRGLCSRGGRTSP